MKPVWERFAAGKHVCMHAKTLQLCRLFATARTVARQAPLSMGLPRQEYLAGGSSERRVDSLPPFVLLHLPKMTKLSQ